MPNLLRLRRAPRREGLFSPVDLLLSLCLFCAGVVLYSVITHALVPTNSQTHEPVYASALQQAALGALAVVMTSGLMASYAALRAWGNAPGARLVAGWRRFGLIPTRPGRDGVAAAAGLILGVPLVMAVGAVSVKIAQALNHPVPPIDHPVLIEMTKTHSTAALAILITTAVALAPLFEEVIYRGLVQTLLLQWLGPKRRGMVILLAAGGFAAIHASLVSWQALPTLLALGLVLGYLYERTASLWPGIVTHAGFNALNIVIALARVKGASG